MLTSLNNELTRFGLSAKQTAYGHTPEAVLDFPISAGDFFDAEEAPARIFYKREVSACTPEEISSLLPEDAPLRFKNQPYFGKQTSSFLEAAKIGRPLAVEGGPCLFGLEEVLVHIVFCSGKEYSFDYSTGRQYLSPAETVNDHSLFSFMIRHSGEIRSLSFEDRKKGVTSQEYDSIFLLFLIAAHFHARVVLPLPDMSYLKYLDAATAGLDPMLRNQALSDFSAIAFRISDLYIHAAQKIAKAFPGTPYTIVHARNRELLEIYYTRRAPIMEKHAVVRILTKAPERLESIKDYVSMPALPWYLFGITDILQVDSLDETDSYRKCVQAHKKKLNLCAFLYPERLSSDGINTVFNANLDHKEYLI